MSSALLASRPRRLYSTPTIITTDSFNRTDSASTLGSTDAASGGTAKAWTAHSGTWGIASNVGYKAAGSGISVASVDSGITDHSVEVVLPTTNPTSAQQAGIIARCADASNYYYFHCYNGGSGQVWYAGKTVAGASTNYLVGATLPAVANGVKMRITCLGSLIDFYIDDVLMYSITDTSLSSQTRCGIYAYRGTAGINDARWDSFNVSTVPAPTYYAGDVLASDSFNRANNSTSLAATDSATGGASKWWNYPTAVWQVNTNVALLSTGTSYKTTTLWVPRTDYKIEAKLSALTATNSSGHGLVARYVDENNYYFLRQFRTSLAVMQWDFGKKVAGSDTFFLSAATSPTPAANDVIALECIGTAIKAYVNGSQISSQTDSAFATGRAVGLYSLTAAGTAARWDDFKVLAA